MNTSPTRYSSSNNRNDRGRPRRAGRLRFVLILLVVLAVVVVILVVALSGGKKPSSSTTTTLSQSASSTTTSSITGSGEDTTTSTSAGTPAAATYTADLGGGNEIPALTTAANGTLTLTVAADGSSVDYVLKLNGIISLTVARLHAGQVGATGATIFTIYGGPTKSGLYSGTIAQGSFTAADLLGPLKGKTIDDLVGLIGADSLYLNVGTQAHIQGEIRGQLH
jgi:CHRD domain